MGAQIFASLKLIEGNVNENLVELKVFSRSAEANWKNTEQSVQRISRKMRSNEQFFEMLEECKTHINKATDRCVEQNKGFVDTIKSHVDRNVDIVTERLVTPEHDLKENKRLLQKICEKLEHCQHSSNPANLNTSVPEVLSNNRLQKLFGYGMLASIAIGVIIAFRRKLN